jgi:hypothetical protein
MKTSNVANSKVLREQVLRSQTLTLLPHLKRKKIIDLPGRVMDGTKLAYPNLALAGGPIAGSLDR